MHENYIVSLSPESFELLQKFLAGLLAFPTLVLPSHGAGRATMVLQTKADPDEIGTGLQLRGQLRNRFIRTGIPF